MFIVIDNKEIQIPVLPSELTVELEGKNSKVEVLQLGEVNRLRKRGLKTISWDSFFPSYMAPYVVDFTGNALDIVMSIDKVMVEAKPIIFILLGNDLDINGWYSIESFSYSEKGGEPGDIYYTIKLTEWVDYSPSKLILKETKLTTPTQTTTKTTATASKPKRTGTPPKPKTYTVVKGDSLWAIAKKFYNDGNQYPKIYDANKEIIDKANKKYGNSKYTIYPGQVLTIP